MFLEVQYKDSLLDRDWKRMSLDRKIDRERERERACVCERKRERESETENVSDGAT